ncbi:hypothetical protein A3Q56_01818 [Intoshia linei]|uniref:Uncharacterized protein n=1 Tax=Intoshia linei TaxID=1819745 RepID=A0A177B8F8_9BILA|nr:hypothetical protein A3Q56_01818 [Intoshia linei]
MKFGLRYDSKNCIRNWSDPKAHFSDPHEWETNKSLSSENESIDDQASIETDFNSDLVPSQAEDLFSNSPSINRMHKKYAIKDNKIIIIPSRKKYQINKFTKDLEHYYFDVNREDLNNYFTKTAMNEILKKLFDFKPILEINEKFFRKIIDKIHPIHVDSISIDSTLYNINYLKDMIIVNFGMSIASIDWQHTNNSDTTHLAVAVNHDKFFSRYIYTENVVINSTITILKIDQLPQSQHTASILLNFDVIGGNILQIKFCPVFSKTDNNSTFLLISLSNGSIMIYKIDLINSKFTKSTLQYESLLKCTLSLIPDYKKNDKRCCISFDWSVSDGGTYVIAGFTDNCLSLWDFKSITDFDSDIFTSIKTINNDKLLGLVELNFIKNNINCLTDTDIIVYNTNLEIVYEYNKFSSDCHSVDIKVFPIDIYFEIVESHRLLKSVFRVIRPDKERKDVITKNFYETESCLAKCSPNMYTNCTALSDYCGNLVLVNIYKDKLPPKSSKYPFPILKMCLKNEQIIISTNNKSKNENFCYKWGYQENQTNIESGIDTLQWNPSLKFYRYLACGSKNGILIIINCKDFLYLLNNNLNKTSVQMGFYGGLQLSY